MLSSALDLLVFGPAANLFPILLGLLGGVGLGLLVWAFHNRP